MRIITGSARGRRLDTLPGESITRPTAQSVKEAIFSMIQFEIEGKDILDLFAGSAQLGIEALSRGARHCTFVEKNAEAAKIAAANIKRCGFESASRLIIGDAVSFVSKQHSFDIAFLDPPYHSALVEKCLPLVENSLNSGGIIICETAAGEELPEMLSSLQQYRSRRYSKTKITVYRKS
ncbi:MAG: 16S rRNA (guanine(966)-N(2))-methyltransferase RsmD [Clostridiales bacterium]|nr:16S rRNA (guanine(966)-N(2))-methyltransferase RsmD [Clostridiales bacterium]